MRIESKIAGCSGVVSQEGDKFMVTVYYAESPEPVRSGPFNTKEDAVDLLERFCHEMDLLEELEDILWRAQPRQ